MDLDLLPDLERKTLIAEQNAVAPTYPVIESQGYYARMSFLAGLGELFTLLSNKQGEKQISVATGIVIAASSSDNVSLLLLDSKVDVSRQPFIATRLKTEFFKVDEIGSLYDDVKPTS